MQKWKATAERMPDGCNAFLLSPVGGLLGVAIFEAGSVVRCVAKNGADATLVLLRRHVAYHAGVAPSALREDARESRDGVSYFARNGGGSGASAPR